MIIDKKGLITRSLNLNYGLKITLNKLFYINLT